MTEPRDDEQAQKSESAELDEAADESIRDLVRGALRAEPAEVPDVLAGVQKKIRQRSRGKFYADGWSTEKAPPVSTYLLTSMVMLGILLVLYALFGYLSGEAVPVQNEPAPVHIVIPRAKPSQ